MTSSFVAYQVIQHKRDGKELGDGELRRFLKAYQDGALPDYQMAALLMAIYFRGLSARELTELVEVMLHSGIVVDLSAISGAKVDKHSTGGVGDKASLVLAPLVAALGVAVPMMSGRGLGHTGGTLDKLESIPGFRTDLSLESYHAQLARIGCAMIGQSARIAPLDKRLYALRDVTGTVESIPLIASSIMSKKLAEGCDALVLDVKQGNGAFMPDRERGIELARLMIEIGAAHGKEVVAFLTAMDRPLGHTIGNALEMEESILTLRGEGPPDLRELVLTLAAEMLCLGGAAASFQEGHMRARKALDGGAALERMRQLVEAQGGNPAVLDDPALLPQAPVRRTLEAERASYVVGMDTRGIGLSAVALGAGRRTLDSRIDAAVGYQITVKPGDRLEAGQPIATVFARSADDAETALVSLRADILVGDAPPEQAKLPLISHRITRSGVEEWSA